MGVHVDNEDGLELRPWSIFSDHGYWVVAKELSDVPHAVARCSTGSASAPHPAMAGVTWEFVRDEDSCEQMMTTTTRIFSRDRAVSLVALPSGCSAAGAHIEKDTPKHEAIKEAAT